MSSYSVESFQWKCTINSCKRFRWINSSPPPNKYHASDLMRVSNWCWYVFPCLFPVCSVTWLSAHLDHLQGHNNTLLLAMVLYIFMRRVVIDDNDLWITLSYLQWCTIFIPKMIHASSSYCSFMMFPGCLPGIRLVWCLLLSDLEADLFFAFGMLSLRKQSRHLRRV